MTGETKTEAVTQALRERMENLKRRRTRKSLADELDEIARHCAALPVLDKRTDNEIIGYDEKGIFPYDCHRYISGHGNTE